MHASAAEVQARHGRAAGRAGRVRPAVERLSGDECALAERAAARCREAPLDVERRVTETEEEGCLPKAVEPADHRLPARLAIARAVAVPAFARQLERSDRLHA